MHDAELSSCLLQTLGDEVDVLVDAEHASKQSVLYWIELIADHDQLAAREDAIRGESSRHVEQHLTLENKLDVAHRNTRLLL